VRDYGIELISYIDDGSATWTDCSGCGQKAIASLRDMDTAIIDLHSNIKYHVDGDIIPSRPMFEKMQKLDKEIGNHASNFEDLAQKVTSASAEAEAAYDNLKTTYL